MAGGGGVGDKEGDIKNNLRLFQFIPSTLYTYVYLSTMRDYSNGRDPLFMVVVLYGSPAPLPNSADTSTVAPLTTFLYRTLFVSVEGIWVRLYSLAVGGKGGGYMGGQNTVKIVHRQEIPLFSRSFSEMVFSAQLEGGGGVIFFAQPLFPQSTHSRYVAPIYSFPTETSEIYE
jgi:hypothetical protein